MVSIGSKALTLRRHKTFTLEDNSLMGEGPESHNLGKKKKAMGRKPQKESFAFDGVKSKKNVSGRVNGGNNQSSKHRNTLEPQKSHVRKQVEPETAKYFLEISNLFETNEVELEERSVICANALEETRGKELELATDYIISHTLQTLLEGSDVDSLCRFLRSCAEVFPSIAMDRSGSHVAETALKSLAMHLEDKESHFQIEETLTALCKVIGVKSVELMYNCYGSHVLRRLLCLCKGVPLFSSEFHGTKSSTVLAERLNFKASRLDGNDSSFPRQGFPDLLKFLLSEMLKCAKGNIKALLVDQYSSLVLQTALKLLLGHNEDLLEIIPVLLGGDKENNVEGNFIKMAVVRDIVDLMKEAPFSHLMEVILEVAPESLYRELFIKVFKDFLFELASHPCGNFVVQALISHAVGQDQMEMIWEKIGPKMKDLFRMGRAGVVASLIAASQRLDTHEHKCSQALAAAVCSTNESPKFIVPHILFLDSYFCCEDKSNWNWTSGAKMHFMGSLILQAVFRYRSEYIQPYITSLISMETDHVLETAKDAGGAHVIEAFLDSNASTKQKRRLVVKLRGNFGQLALHSSGSFTIEKCYTASSMSLRESIVSELLAVRSELSKTKQGPYLLRKLDVEGFSARPDQWRSRQISKESAYKEFYDAFGSSETKSSRNNTFVADSSKHTLNPQDLKKMRKEIDDQLVSAAPYSGKSGSKRHSEKAEHGFEKYAKYSMGDDISKGKKKSRKR